MMAGESSRRHPRISHVSNSTIGSDSDFVNYIVTIPDTPDNNPAWVQIASRDIETGSSQKDDNSDQTDPRLSLEEDLTLLHKPLNPLTRTVKNSPIIVASGSSYKDGESDLTDPRISGEGEGEEEEEEEEDEYVTLLHTISNPLTRIVKISPIIIALYRILILVRIVSLGLFISWRIGHPNEKAIWLWLLSVICEIWFAFSWLLDQIPKLFPVNHATDIEALKTKFDSQNPNNPTGKSDLPGIDVFVSTADVEKEHSLVTANTILSILSADYPVEMLSCYISDDEASLLTFEVMGEAVSFAKTWVPFCRKHKIEPRNPETYFGLKWDTCKDKVRDDFVRDRAYVKRGYEEFKVRVNALAYSIRERSDAFNSKQEIKALEKWKKNWKVMDKEDQVKEPRSSLGVTKSTWMRDGTLWPGSWIVPCRHHSRDDHASIIQVLLDPRGSEPLKGRGRDGYKLDFEGVDIRLPMLVYVSREIRPGYDQNKKAEAINALLRASTTMSNGPFILNLDFDNYVYNSRALRDGICVMMDRDGDSVSFVQFPQRVEGIHPSNPFANNNTVFVDVNLRALDGNQSPMYVGTGRLFRRTALYGTSDLPGIDVFVSTADAEKEPPLVTANTILSILSVDYPVEKLSCYLSDDGGSLLTFEAMAEAASFAKMWVPFCRKHKIEPRNPESYFGLKSDPYKDKVRHDFVRERRYVKRGYEEFKVRVNALSNSIRRRSDAFNSKEEVKALEKWKNWKVLDEEVQMKQPRPNLVAPKATWMGDGALWPGTWSVPCPHHSRGDHAGIIQVLLDPPGSAPVKGIGGEGYALDFEGVDIRLPMLVYVSREKRPGYDHNKKAGAMNALVRASAIMSNGPFILNLDCDHYVYNSRAFRDGICFMMDHGGDHVSFVQFPQRFEGIDPSDRYANKNTVFFDINLRALDGIQGPMYVGTGCLFRRTALYGFNPPDVVYAKEDTSNCCGCCFPRIKKRSLATVASEPEYDSDDEYEDRIDMSLIPKQFGCSSMLVDSVKVAEFQGRPLASECSSGGRGRTPGSLTASREPLDYATVSEAVNVISCWYEDKTEWGSNVGWIYGSVTEDVVTGYRMHEKGWRSFYCVTEPDAFRGTVPINLTDRLHQVLRWATGSVEILFSRNNAILAGSKLKFLQRIAYVNVGIYPFTSIFILTYCFLPPLSLFSGQFVVDGHNPSFLAYLLVITLSLCGLAVLECRWSGITLEEWWRNEQFWLIGGTSAHFVAVLQGILKVIAGIEISFTLTSKSSGDDEDDEFADLYEFKWTSLMIPPLTIIILNIVGILFAVCRTIFTEKPNWSNLIGGAFFAIWVLAHMYPFAKGLMGRRGRTPTIVYVWSGLIAICFSLLYVTIKNQEIDGGSFQLT